MNFHVYLDENLGNQIEKFCQVSHKKRNAIVREALRLYLQQQKKSTWPDSILSFEGMKDFPAFELYRKEFPPESRENFLE